MSDEKHYPRGRFGGDMDRNEVEMDLNKFMAMVQEIGELKDKIRDLEDVTKANPYQKVIFVAQAIDSWRIFPRVFLSIPQPRKHVLGRHCSDFSVPQASCSS